MPRTEFEENYKFIGPYDILLFGKYYSGAAVIPFYTMRCTNYREILLARTTLFLSTRCLSI